MVGKLLKIIYLFIWYHVPYRGRHLNGTDIIMPVPGRSLDIKKNPVYFGFTRLPAGRLILHRRHGLSSRNLYFGCLLNAGNAFSKGVF